MTLEELKLKVKNRIESMDQTYEKDPGYARCKKFTTDYSVSSAKEFLSVDIYEFIRCLLYVKTEGKISIEECSELIDQLKMYLINTPSKYMATLFEVMYYISTSKAKDAFQKCLREKNELKAISDLKKIDLMEEDIFKDTQSQRERKKQISELFLNLRRIQKSCDIARIIDIMAEYKEDLVYNILTLIETQKQMQEEVIEFEKLFGKSPTNVPERIKKKIKKDFVKDCYNMKAILSCYKEIDRFVLNEESKEKAFYRELKKEESGLETAMTSLLRELQKIEITNAREIVKTVKDEELKKAFLQIIYEHNKKYYDSLEKKLTELNQNKKINHLAKIRSFGIYVDEKELEKIMRFSLEELDELIKIFKDLSMNIEQAKELLLVTTIEKARTIKDYVDKEYLEPRYVWEHFDLWIEESSDLDRLRAFYTLLQQYNLNPKLFSKAEDVLDNCNQCVEKNLELLNYYRLIQNTKNTQCLDFIAEKDLNRKIETIIECGAFNLLQVDLDILNCQNLKRLFLLREMNFPFDMSEETKKILLSDRTFISDFELDNYITNVLPIKEEINIEISMEKLEEMRQDEWSYRIGNILVSSEKVGRLLRSGNSLYQSIFTGLKINEDEYQEMLKALSIQTNKIM